MEINKNILFSKKNSRIIKGFCLFIITFCLIFALIFFLITVFSTPKVLALQPVDYSSKYKIWEIHYPSFKQIFTQNVHPFSFQEVNLTPKTYKKIKKHKPGYIPLPPPPPEPDISGLKLVASMPGDNLASWAIIKNGSSDQVLKIGSSVRNSIVTKILGDSIVLTRGKLSKSLYLNNPWQDIPLEYQSKLLN